MAQLAERRRGDRIGTSAGLLAIGTSVANALGYVLTLVAARRLEPAEFGAFGALLAVVIVGNVAALAGQATTAREIARGRDGGAATRAALALAAGAGLVLAALSPVLQSVLRLPSLGAPVAAAVSVAALAGAAPALGVAQGAERFRRLAALVSAQAALRVAGGLAGLAVRPSAAAALIGVAAGLVAATGLAWTASRPPVGGRDRAGRATLASGAMLLGFVVLTNVDVLLARHVLSAEASGVYAAGSIFTKVAFWLPQFVPLVAYPAMTDPSRRTAMVVRAATAVAALGAALVLGAWWLAEPAVRLVTGPGYAELVPTVAGFTALGALYALGHLLVYAHLARGDRWTTAVLWLVLAIYVLIVETTADSVVGVLAPGLAAAVVVVLWGVGRERWRPTLPG